MSAAASHRGIYVGMLLTRAIMVASDLQVIPVETSPVAHVTAYLSKRFHSISPRISCVEVGCFWLEPFSPTDDEEAGFVSQAFGLLRDEGFDDARMGVADTVVASNAASRLVGAYEWMSVGAGGDASFLAPLSLDFLPIGDRLRKLLDDVGIRSVRELQSFSNESIQRRFGPAGLRAWTLAWANDPRGPRTPNDTTARTLRVSLMEPTASVEAILFILKGSVERLACNLRKEHLAAKRLELCFGGEGGEKVTLPITFSSPTCEVTLLFERIAHTLREDGLPRWSGAEIESVAVTVTEEVPFTPKQQDLWSSTSLDPHLIECLAMKVEKALSGRSFVMPALNDSQKPERQSRWIRRHDSEERSICTGHIESERMGLIASCTKIIDSPSTLQVRGQGILPSEIFASSLSELGWIRITTWYGPETISGGWWDGPYERDYYWAVSEDQHAVWIFFDRLESRWFIHGWLD